MLHQILNQCKCHRALLEWHTAIQELIFEQLLKLLALLPTLEEQEVKLVHEAYELAYEAVARQDELKKYVAAASSVEAHRESITAEDRARLLEHTHSLNRDHRAFAARYAHLLSELHYAPESRRRARRQQSFEQDSAATQAGKHGQSSGRASQTDRFKTSKGKDLVDVSDEMLDMSPAELFGSWLCTDVFESLALDPDQGDYSKQWADLTTASLDTRLIQPSVARALVVRWNSDFAGISMASRAPKLDVTSAAKLACRPTVNALVAHTQATHERRLAKFQMAVAVIVRMAACAQVEETFSLERRYVLDREHRVMLRAVQSSNVNAMLRV